MKEFLDFLCGESPYDALSSADLAALANCIEVEFFASGTAIVPLDAPPLSELLVIRTGEVEVVDRGSVVDVLGPGDTFGHVSVLSGLPPDFHARASEDTLIYRLPDPRGIVSEPDRLSFARYATRESRRRLTDTTRAEATRRPVSRQLREIVWADATTSMRAAAQLMSEAGQSCILVRLRDGTLGIATDQDFRSLVARQDALLDAPVANIATTPVLSVPEDATVTAAFLEMVEHGVHHLLVTSRSEQPLGFVRIVDLASADVREPLVVRAAVDGADSLDALAGATGLLPATVIELSDFGVPPLQIAALLSTVRDHIVRRAIELCGDEGRLQGVDISWLALGSLARRESLPSSDVDTALIWARLNDVVVDAEVMREYAEHVLVTLETCGLRRCPKGANASNPLFSRSVEDWHAVSGRWTSEPSADGSMLLASIVTDSRGLTSPALARQVTDSMRQAGRNRAFVDRLLWFTLENKPPTGFVRDIVVLRSGKHHGKLDLKKCGLVPIAAIGRWLGVTTGDATGTTVDRLRRGSAANLLTVGEVDALVGAYEEIYEIVFARDLDALRHGIDLGRGDLDLRIAPRDLDPLARRFLRESFREIDLIQGQLRAAWTLR